MPEGDVLHRAAAAVRVLQGERVAAESPNPRGLATGVAAVVDGRVLETVEAVGKNLLLGFEGGVTLRSHLRMSGRWRVQRVGTRVLGTPWLVLRGTEWEALQWNGPVLEIRHARPRVGPDVVAPGADVARLVAAVRAGGSGRVLGEVLQDQRVVAGIGNMWAAEALWRARLSPWLPAPQATPDELDTLLGWVADAMRRAVSGAREPRAVYRRAGRPCGRCGASIRSRGLGDANRTAYWCPGCQRGPGPPPVPTRG